MNDTKQKLATLNPDQVVDIKIFEVETRIRKLLSDQVQTFHKRDKETKLIIADLNKTVEEQKEQISSLQGQVRNLQYKSGDFEDLHKKLADVEERLREELSKYAEDIITAKANTETVKNTTEQKLAQMKELEQTAGQLKGHIGKYSTLLSAHKTHVDQILSDMNLKVESFLTETDRKVTNAESICKTLKEKEESKYKQIAKLQAGFDIMQNLVNESKKHISQLRQTKADIPLIREVENMWNHQLQGALYRMDLLHKEVNYLKNKVTHLLEESSKNPAEKVKEEIMEYIKTLQLTPKAPTEPETKKEEVTVESKSEETKEETSPEKEKEPEIPKKEGPYEYYDGELVLNDSNEKYFTLHSGDTNRRMSYSPLPSYKKSFNIKMMVQGDITMGEARNPSIPIKKLESPIRESQNSRNALSPESNVVSSTIDPEAIKDLETKYNTIQTTFDESLKRVQVSLETDKQTMDDKVNRFVSKLRRERNDIV